MSRTWRRAARDSFRLIFSARSPLWARSRLSSHSVARTISRLEATAGVALPAVQACSAAAGEAAISSPATTASSRAARRDCSCGRATMSLLSAQGAFPKGCPGAVLDVCTREGACMPTAAILDIDGTLVDTNYHHALAWYRAFR